MFVSVLDFLWRVCLCFRLLVPNVFVSVLLLVTCLFSVLDFLWRFCLCFRLLVTCLFSVLDFLWRVCSPTIERISGPGLRVQLHWDRGFLSETGPQEKLWRIYYHGSKRRVLGVLRATEAERRPLTRSGMYIFWLPPPHTPLPSSPREGYFLLKGLKNSLKSRCITWTKIQYILWTLSLLYKLYRHINNIFMFEVQVVCLF